VELSFDLDVDVRCVGCGAERDFPERAERALEGDVLYADVTDPCACGSRRVRVDVQIDDRETEAREDDPPRLPRAR
jgi:hypothetical protein